MKSLKTTISITELQKTIKIWRSRKITDSTIPKLLDLYLGLTAYMNDKHIYPVENFYDIKMSLRFSTTQSLIEAVKASQSFKFIVNEGQKQIKAFYSPLCHEENSKLETKEDSKTSQSSLNLPQAFAQTLAVDNIYNIYTKGNSSDEELSPKSEATLEDKSSKKDNDFLQRIDIRDILLDAGYRQNRRFGLRLSSFIRTDNEGKRIRGDKFVITQHGKCCCQPPQQKEYNVVSFIKEHPTLFAEYYEGMDLNQLVDLVCSRLLNIPVEEEYEVPIVQPQREIRPFDITEYDIQKFDPKDREVQKKFAPYFKHRGIDLGTQHAFYRDFCLATRHCEDGHRDICLAFPMALPQNTDRIVGFEECGRARLDGQDSYKGMAEGSNTDEGLWIASPARTPLAEAKHIYWFGSAYDAMAFYQLHRAQNQELRKAVFISTGGDLTEKQMRGVLEQTIPARQHICFDNDHTGSVLARSLQKEIYRTIREAIEVTPERKPYLDSIPDGDDLDGGEFYLLPKGGLQESCIEFDAERDEAFSMSSSRLCAPEDVQDQINRMNKCYREFRVKLREFLGIDKEHDVAITRKEPDYRYTSWNGQLLAERKQQEASVGQGQEQEPEEKAGQERQTHFRR